MEEDEAILRRHYQRLG